MKFKQKDAQNQRIEKITTNHLVVGIDVAKEIHVTRAVNYRGIEIGKYCRFSNDEHGFKHFLTWIDNLKKQHKKNKVIIGMEPTGHYWLNLAYWLIEQDLEAVVVNPYHVKKNKENRDNSPTKNDIKDALVIADMVKNGYYSVLELPTKVYKALRETMSLREFVNKQSVSVKNQIHRWIDLWFPEYPNIFKDWTCKTSIVTLKLFPTPKDIKSLRPDEIVAQWKEHMKRAGSFKTAQLLVQYAHRTIGQEDGMDYAKKYLGMLLDQYEQLTQQLENLEQQAIELLEHIPEATQIQKLKGMGAISTACILAETGKLSGYEHGNQVMRLAGLHLGEDSSGKHKGKVVITKRGRSLLRKMLYLTVMNMVKNNPEFRALHQFNVKTKKMRKNQSLLKLCGKLARILVGIVRRGETYCPEKVCPQPLAA